MTIYALDSALIITLFYLLERLFLRGNTQFYAQRTYYIVAIVSSLLLPLVAILSPDIRSLLLSFGHSPSSITISIEGITAVATPDGGTEPSLIHLLVGRLIPLLQVIWAIGALVMTLRYLYGHWSITSILRRSERMQVGEQHIYMTDKGTPFTYIQRISIPKDMCSSPIFQMVMKHELIHVQQRHYIDMLLGSLLQILQWWNPFAWGLTTLQKDTLEYIADDEVLRSGTPPKEYQLYLLKSTLGGTADSLLLSFSMYNLKQRIFMMNRKKTTQTKVRLGYALVSLSVMIGSFMSIQALNASSVFYEPKMASGVMEKNRLDNDSIFLVVDQIPEFPGGTEEMMKFLAENIIYPEAAHSQKIQGRVITSFVVEKDGTLSDIKVLKSVDPLLDAEAIRVISSMPKWKPGRQKGQTVRTKMSIPIFFRLRNADVDNTPSEKKAFKVIDVVPEYPGGINAMMEFIRENMRYPEAARSQKIQGRVITSFVVEKDGTLSDIKILESVDPLLDAEAIRVISSMPNWKPGMNDGEYISTRFTIPIIFKIPNDDQEKKAE